MEVRWDDPTSSYATCLPERLSCDELNFLSSDYDEEDYAYDKPNLSCPDDEWTEPLNRWTSDAYHLRATLMMSGLNHSTGGLATFTTYVSDSDTVDVTNFTTDATDDVNRFTN
jgi:hypothetical protein